MKREQTFLEEVCNSGSHAIGALLASIGLYELIMMSLAYGSATHVVSTSIYGTSLIMVFLASAVYHASPSRWRPTLKIVDHACIYLLIAGTYTPVALVVLQGAWGWSIFGIIWGCAALGISFKVFGRGRFRGISTVTYVMMGWLVVIALGPLLDRLDYGGFLLILGGGIAYSVGAIFYAFNRPFFHVIFHLFVVAAGALHYMAVYYYILPKVVSSPA